MFELVNLDLCLLQFCSGLLILLSLTSLILQGCFSTLYVLECPAPGLLVADFMPSLLQYVQPEWFLFLWSYGFLLRWAVYAVALR